MLGIGAPLLVGPVFESPAQPLSAETKVSAAKATNSLRILPRYLRKAVVTAQLASEFKVFCKTFFESFVATAN
jgi:hypothetical protein